MDWGRAGTDEGGRAPFPGLDGEAEGAIMGLVTMRNAGIGPRQDWT